MRRFRPFLALVCLCLMTYASIGKALAAEEVWVALSDGGGAYAEAAEAARREIQRGGVVAVEILPWQQFLGAGRVPPRLVIALGSGALAGMAESELRAPLLATLLPRVAYERQAERAGQFGRVHSAVFLDQPPARQLDLLRLALPERRRVGVVFGPESRQLAPLLRRAAGERGLVLATVEAPVGGNLFPLLQALFDESDLLLALPDPAVYNGLTIQNILTAAYRHRIPLIGFSPAYVKAGALLSLYSTPAQVGAQAGEIARGVLAGRPLPPPQGPRDFSVAVNVDVARSLGVAMEADAGQKWTEQLRQKERLP